MFLGFANFYHWFIHKYSTIAAPLNNMIKGTAAHAGYQKFKKGEFYNDPNFNITEYVLHAFEELKSNSLIHPYSHTLILITGSTLILMPQTLQ